MYSRLKKYVRAALEHLDRWYVLRNIHHLVGEKPSSIKQDEYSVVSLIKNVEYFLDEFIQYHQRLGAKHIYLIDNSSSDHTIELSTKYERVTIYTTTLNFSLYESRIRGYFIKKYFPMSWVLCVDADEHFDYPCSNKISMSDFITYLREHSYTAVAACMLDMFPREKYSNLPEGSFSSVYKYVDISEIRKEVYPTDWYCSRGNKVPKGVISYSGGIRKKISNASGDYLLIKHPLIYVTNDLIPFTHPHYSANLSIADVTCVLLHYKFVMGFEKRMEHIATDKESHQDWARENRACVESLSVTSGENIFFSENAMEYQTVEDLSDKGLLFISTGYKNCCCKD